MLAKEVADYLKQRFEARNGFVAHQFERFVDTAQLQD